MQKAPRDASRSCLLAVLSCLLVAGCDADETRPEPLVRDGAVRSDAGPRAGDGSLPVGSPQLDASTTVSAGDAAVGMAHVPEASLPAPPAPIDEGTLFADARLIDEVDPCTAQPVYESAAGASAVGTALERCARVMLPGDQPKVMAFRIGVDKGLRPGSAYLLDIEYPDDVSRGFFLINRGADFARGFATGKALGDSRQQYVNATLESLDYPQSGRWQNYRQLFFLNDRMQDVLGVRGAEPGSFPHTPEQGFHVVLFQVPKSYDLRSEGVAIGKIRLYEIPDVRKWVAPIERPPAELPQRHVFWREEMSDMIIQAKDALDRGVSEPRAWYRYKMQLAKVLGIDVFGKDLLEFGHNSGWASGDIAWFNEAQPPNKDLWAEIVAVAKEERMPLVPYYEYKGAIGWAQPNRSLGHQRRAHKLYHGIHKTCDEQRTDKYTCTYWVEDHNADLTDPDTLLDLQKVLDKTILRFKGEVEFMGAWLRTRQTHLPVSFAPATIARFKADHVADRAAQAASQSTLIDSYEGDRALYDRYIAWWFGKRRDFLRALQEYVASASGNPAAQVIFTPWATEAVPPFGPGFLTDDPQFFSKWVAAQPASDDNRWRWQPASISDAIANNGYAAGLTAAEDIAQAWSFSEEFHAVPYADPENYREVDNVMLSYPIGRMITVANPALLQSFRAASGLTVAHHFTLNEDNAEKGDRTLNVPFHGEVGYVSIDVDRAGPHLMLNEARALAAADPRNLAILSGSSFSSGFPEQMRRFHRAFLALPALPSVVLTDASSDPEVVVREIATPRHGRYYAVVNTSMHEKSVRITLPAAAGARDLLSGARLAAGALALTLPSAELRAYHVAP